MVVIALTFALLMALDEVLQIPTVWVGVVGLTGLAGVALESPQRDQSRDVRFH